MGLPRPPSLARGLQNPLDVGLSRASAFRFHKQEQRSPEAAQLTLEASCSQTILLYIDLKSTSL